MTNIEMRSGARHEPVVDGRRGFTLVELVVAIVILSIGILGLASTAAVVTKQMASGGRQTVAASVAQSRFELFRSYDCHTLVGEGINTSTSQAYTTTGTATTRGIKEDWTITDSTNVKIVKDSVTFWGRKQPLIYKSELPCRDSI
jgi:prepilin-type N-terminal cleavage/methylation domain-containing protein